MSEGENMKKFVSIVFVFVMLALSFLTTGCATAGRTFDGDKLDHAYGDIPKIGSVIEIRNVDPVKPEVGPMEYYISWCKYGEKEVYFMHLTFSPFGFGDAPSKGNGHYYVDTFITPFRLNKIEWAQ